MLYTFLFQRYIKKIMRLSGNILKYYIEVLPVGWWLIFIFFLIPCFIFGLSNKGKVWFCCVFNQKSSSGCYFGESL